MTASDDHPSTAPSGVLDNAGSAETPLRLQRRTQGLDAATGTQARDLFIGGPVAVLVWRPESRWRVCDASPNVAHLFGYSVEQILDPDFHYMSLIHPEDADRVAVEVVRALNEGRKAWEQRYRVVHPDGRVRWLYDFTIVDRSDASGTCLLRGYVMDETRMRHRERDFQALVASISEAVWISETPTGRLYANPAAQRLSGHTAAGGWTDLIAPRDRARLGGLLECVEAGESAHGQLWIRRADLTEVQIDLRLQPLDDGRCLGIGHNATEPRAAETGPQAEQTLMDALTRTIPEDLNDSQEFYRAIVDQASDSIVLIDARTLRFVAFNDAACQSLGYSRAEFARLGIADIEAKLSPRGLAYWHQVINQSGAGDLETCHRHKNGALRYAQVSNRRVNIGQQFYWAAIWRDITERKRIETELAEHQRHLEALVHTRTAELERARLDAELADLGKSLLLANMSHEVRAPLNAIIGLIHRIKTEASDQAQSQRLEQVSEAADQLRRVSNDILNLSRMEGGLLHLESTDFELRHSLARLDLLLSAEVATKGLRLRVMIDPTLPARLHGDPARLGQILLDLTSTAVKFSDQGTVTVKAHRIDDVQDRVQIRFEIHNEALSFPQTNQGSGLPAFAQSDLLTASPLSGSGPGLAISKCLVELMGGELGVEHQPGAGGTLWFTAGFGSVVDAD